MSECEWFILRVQGRRVSSIIEAIGSESCWMPIYRTMTKPANKHKPVAVDRPILPGWLFVKADQYGKWEDLSGVHGSLKMGRLGPIFIKDEALEGLRESEVKMNRTDGIDRDGPVFKPPIGSKVSLEGLLFGRKGTVERHGSGDYVIVNIGGLSVTVSARALTIDR